MGNNNQKTDPKVLQDAELEWIVSRTGLSKEAVLTEHVHFLNTFPEGLASKTDFAKLFSKFKDISGVKATPEKFCDFLFKLFDKNDDGRVSFGEFTIAFGLSASNLTEKNLLSYADKLFDLLDKNRDNKLNKKEISFLVESIFDLETSNQNNLVKNEVAEVLDVYSEKESGFLNREEFAEFFIDGQIFEYFFGVASVIQHGALDTVQNQPKN